jgi:hypothetical protein
MTNLPCLPAVDFQVMEVAVAAHEPESRTARRNGGQGGPLRVGKGRLARRYPPEGEGRKPAPAAHGWPVRIAFKGTFLLF